MNLYGLLAESSPLASVLVPVIGFLALGYLGAQLIVWTAFIAAMLFLLGASPVVCLVVGVPLLIFNLVPVRRALITKPLVSALKKMNVLPAISETEMIALKAGSTWVEQELFAGKPDFAKIAKEPYKKISGEELEFLNGPVDELCKMSPDWEVYKNGDLSAETWAFIKKHKFFGLGIPKEYGGLGFSALANSEIVSKISTRSGPLAVTIMVPNSLGPAELLHHYGTQEQKDHYLPRLADGREIPCFALTEPNAGSDAGSMTSNGVVVKGEDGKLYVKLNWNKRYITLAAISTLIGLAIKLHDPDNLLGKGEDLGITCILVPSSSKGVILGKRHNPMGVPFYNCPTIGEDVVVSVDQIIGGPEGAGQGWKMLMECLGIGRSISLPAQAAGGAKVATRAVGAYSAIRKQFGLEIGKFEGIEEPMARIGGLTYLVEASRIFGVGAVDKGLKPAVSSAIAKYNTTELARIMINDAMDILGGAAISRGPRNILANMYVAAPIGITVEGANILTRTLIIFGQGAIRCHPYAFSELTALMEGDATKFDKYFFKHIGFALRNTCRSLLLSLTRGHLARVPGGPMKKYYRKLAWSSATFAFMADLALGSYGGGLKMKEKLSGRYADVLSWMYLITATLHRFEAEGRRKDHEVFVTYACEYGFAKIQEAFDGIFANIEIPLLTKLFRGPVLVWHRLNGLGRMPSDEVTAKIAHDMMVPGELRDSLTWGVYLSGDKEDNLGRYEHTLTLVTEAAAIYKKIYKAVKAKKLPKGKPHLLVDQALEAGVITADEAKLAKDAEEARNDAVQVDSFDVENFKTNLLIEDKQA